MGTKSYKPVQWPDIVRVLPGPTDASWLANFLRDHGKSLDSCRTSKASRQTLCEGLIRLEDMLELRQKHTDKWVGKLAKVRNVRRKLESEVYR